MRLPGKHIAMVNRCLSNRDVYFKGAVDRFLGEGFGDTWWWSEHVAATRKNTGPPRQAALSKTTGVRADALASVLSSLSASTTAPTHLEASTSCSVNVAPAVQQAAQELLGKDTSADAPLMDSGLDSLGAVEFRSRLSSQLGDVKLPETLIFDFPTLRQIEAHVGSLLTKTKSRPPQAAGSSVLSLLSSLLGTSTAGLTAVLSTRKSTSSPKASCIHAIRGRLGGATHGSMASLHMGSTGYDAVASVPSTRWYETSDDLHPQVTTSSAPASYSLIFSGSPLICLLLASASDRYCMVHL